MSARIRSAAGDKWNDARLARGFDGRGASLAPRPRRHSSPFFSRAALLDLLALALAIAAFLIVWMELPK